MATTGTGSGGSDSWIVHQMASMRNPFDSRKPADPRKGLNQILEMKDLATDSSPSCSPSSSSPLQLQTQVDSPQSDPTPWYFPQLGAAATEEEAGLNESWLDGGQHTGSFEEEPASLSTGDPSTAQSSSSNPDGQVTAVIDQSSRELEPAATQNNRLLAEPNRGGAAALFNATGAAMMGMGQTLVTGPPAAWQGLMSRVQTTLRGSADDIGWLQKDPSLPSVVDKTDRFVMLLGRISNGVHVLPDSLVYLLIPGLFSNHGPLYFVDTKKYFSKLGLACHIARIHSEAGVEKNARELKDHIEELYWGTGKRVILLGHSKGGVDAAAACAIYWPDLKDKVVGLAFAQSPYGGSPIASDILRAGQIADFETRRILELVITKFVKGDIQALEDLTYEKRRAFVARHPLPIELPTVSFHTEASRAPGVLSTMSHIAHAELPWLPLPTSPTSEEPGAGAKLPVAIPLAAAMALCALHLDLRYGEKSDGLVARKDAEVPGSVVVRPVKKLDHAWMVYSPSKKEVHEADAAQMCEALLTLLLEEEAARKPADSHGDRSPLPDEISNTSSSAPRTMPSTEIQAGEEYLENL